MKLITYRKKGEHTEQIGLLHPTGEKVISISDLGLSYSDMNDLIINITPADYETLNRANNQTSFPISINDIHLEAPIPRPNQDIICLGVNYREHAREAAEYEKEAFDLKNQYPVYFSKRVNRASAIFQEIPAYEGLVDSLDYEAELAVIIGKDAKDVPKGESLPYLFGYTILNDVSARNLQTRHSQWYFGKSLDGFAPMGPCIVTKDEIPYPPKLDIKCFVNEELRQSANTEQLIFDIDHVIHELSQGMTLKAGTVISMGTPQGVGMGLKPPRFLRPGDKVKVVIPQIGELENHVSGGKEARE